MGAPERFDAIVIGTGQAGKPLAVALGTAGKSVAVVEQAAVGGTCINYGCTPTKTMVASARVAYLARRAADFGVVTGPMMLDQSAVRARKRDIVASFSSGGQRQLERLETVSLIFGSAAFTGPDAVRVTLAAGGTRELTAPTIVINTGARPVVPDLRGLDGVPHLDSTSIMELGKTPEHLLVLGGGYIGLEFGQMFRRFGSRVTVIQRSARLLGREDADIADAVAEVLREDGVTVLLETATVAVRRTVDGVALRVKGPEGERELRGTHLLVATGRAPNSDRLNLEAAGVKVDRRGFIQVNDRLETSAPGILALGDVNGGPAFTHVSYDDYRVARANLLDGGNATRAGRMVPYTMFMDPQFGRVGLSEDDARERGLNVRVAKMPMTYVARALEMDESRGFMKAIVGEDDRILGAAVLGIEGGEICSMLQIAMMGGLRWQDLRDAVFPHPGFAEAFNNLFARLGD